MANNNGIVSIFLVSDNLLFREFFSLWMNRDCNDVELLASAAGNINQVLEICERLRPDIFLLTLDLERCDALTLCEEVRSKHPSIKIIVLACNNIAPQTVSQLVDLGVLAFVQKSVGSIKLLDVIRQVYYEGHAEDDPIVFLSRAKDAAATPKPAPVKTESLLPSLDNINLSRREWEILRLVSAGETNKGIATQLGISEHTVRNHISNIFHKLGVKNRTTAARMLSQLMPEPH